MKVINDVGNQAIYNAIVASIQKPSETKLRVTELIDSPRIKRLRLLRWDDIEILASKQLFRLHGTHMHDLVARNAATNTLTEEKLTIPIMRETTGAQYHMSICGTPDLYEESGELSDYKFVSLWSFLRTKPEWSHQLNIYRRMLEIHGFSVKKMTIQATLRDWSASQACFNPDYPQSPFKAVDIPFEPNIDKYIDERVDAHLAAIAELPLCSPEETWVKPTTWAVTKKGNKKAKAVFGTDKRPGNEADARDYIRQEIPEKDHRLFEVITRPGRVVRCEAYCDVALFCTQWQMEKARLANETTDTEDS